MRGILVPLVRASRPAGITPAHAGNTRRREDTGIFQQDHPRACGEYTGVLPLSANVQGSPPRMRGIQASAKDEMSVYGITPAHAGNTCTSDTGTTAGWDHPRACGEYTQSLLSSWAYMGSPPRMRGIQTFFFFVPSRLGITPAHAGNTVTRPDFLLKDLDHPRACGEYRWCRVPCWTCSGSPPRMRGILVGSATNAVPIGITPAHAGNTNSPGPSLCLYEDHPRACGEYTKKSHDIAVHLARNPNFYLVSKFTRMES